MNALLLKAAPYLIAIAVSGGWLLSHNAKQREIGAMRERLHVADSSLAVARTAGRRIDSVFRVDTVKLTRRISTTQTLIDTLLHSDTVTLTKRESVLVFVADSLVQQCRQTINSCSARVSNLTEQLLLTATQRDAYRKLVPSGFQRARSAFLPALIGAGVTYLLVKR